MTRLDRVWPEKLAESGEHQVWIDYNAGGMFHLTDLYNTTLFW